MQVTERLKQLLALRLLKNMGPKAFQNGLTAFGSLEGFFQAGQRHWSQVEVLSRLDRKPLTDKAHLEAVDKELALAARNRVEIISCFDSRYPALLKEIFDPPILLYVKGRLPDDSCTFLAVVGSREASPHGLRIAGQVSKDLAAAGAVVVSGLARGIDSAAHSGALEAGRTVAVLGNGLATVYPPENKRLADKIASAGAVLSEFPMNEPSKASNFPLRNRIISGLSRAVIVIEARQMSGALITAGCALEQGRDVYVFPGNAGSGKTLGSNNLLKEGAIPVTDASEILRDFGFSVKTPRVSGSPKRAAVLSQEEDKLLRLLKKAESLHVDEIVEKSLLSPQKTLTLLTALAVKGAVRELPGKYFSEIE